MASDIERKNRSIFQTMITNFGVPQIFQKDLLDELMLKFAPSNAIVSFNTQEEAKLHILEFIRSLNIQQQGKPSSSSQGNNNSGSSGNKPDKAENKNQKILQIYKEFKENILKDIKTAKELIKEISPALEKSANKIVEIISQDPELLNIYQQQHQSTLDKISSVNNSTNIQQVAELSIKIANDLLIDEKDHQKQLQLQQISQQNPRELESQIKEQLDHQHDRLKKDLNFAVKHDLFSMLYSQSTNTALQQVLNTGKIEVVEDKESALGIDFVKNKNDLQAPQIAEKNRELITKKQQENHHQFGNIDSNLFLLGFGDSKEQLNIVSYFAIKLINHTKEIKDPETKINDLLSAFNSKTQNTSLFQRITAEKLTEKTRQQTGVFIKN